MDPYQPLIDLLKSAPLPVIYAAAIVWLGKKLLSQNDDFRKEQKDLVDRYHELGIENVKQLTIIAEELKRP